jgi:hypothetical protein
MESFEHQDTGGSAFSSFTAPSGAHGKRFAVLRLVADRDVCERMIELLAPIGFGTSGYVPDRESGGQLFRLYMVADEDDIRKCGGQTR